MQKKFFNNFNMSNDEIEKIILYFDKDITQAVYKITGSKNEDYEKIVKFQIFKTLSKNRKN